MIVVSSYLGLVATCYMTGIVWFAQVVHYPLLGAPHRTNDFTVFAEEYQRRTFRVVMPGLAAEALSTVLLLVLWPSLQSAAGAVCLALIWWLTFFYQIPYHRTLAQGYCATTHQRLVRSNLPRSILWTIRSVVMLWTVHSV